MKLAFIATLKVFFRKHLIKIAIACAAIVVAVGLYFGWNHYQYRQSSDYAFLRLQAAFNPPDPQQLAVLMDFNTISLHMAKAINREFPFFMHGPTQLRDTREIIQTSLLKKLRTKEEPPKEEEKDTNPDLEFKKNIYIMPGDCIMQLSGTMALKKIDEQHTLVTAQVEHLLFKERFSLVFSMVNGTDGWIVKDLVNADELVKQFRKCMLKRLHAYHQHLLGKNESTRKKMASTLELNSCTASGGMLSDGKTFVVIAHVLARNKSNYTIKNVNFDAVFKTDKGIVMQKFLNAAISVLPGEDLNHRWSIELTGDSPESRKIIEAGGLTCDATLKTLVLSNSDVLHIRDIPESLENCNTDQHDDHPMGFCILPVFSH